MKVLKNSGFTMVELMIVVIIIGILAGIAIPNYMRSVETAKCSQGMAILKNMRTAELDYFRENDVFTNLTSDLESQVGGTFANTNDWTFTIATTASTFTLTATRTSGPHGTDTLVLNETENWSNSTYDYNNPGNF